MDREDHRSLLQKGVTSTGGTWADFGSGTGAFTAALAGLLGGTGRIFSVDTDARALREQGRVIREAFPLLHLELVRADYTKLSDMPPLDGAVAANSLHYQRDLVGALRLILTWLKPGAGLVVVEYDVRSASPWIPFPLPPARLEEASAAAGYAEAKLLAARPSAYNRRVYSMFCRKTGRA
ncbi:MAG TPA: class I SAM-dependent methyltransferase [Spirochaetia bacterium]|nr:class I SAM-dependent methyltransferase [Spirochaetia bacterium]